MIALFLVLSIVWVLTSFCTYAWNRAGKEVQAKVHPVPELVVLEQVCQNNISLPSIEDCVQEKVLKEVEIDSSDNTELTELLSISLSEPKIDYSSLNIKQLRLLGSLEGMKGASRWRKSEALKALQEAAA